ncbi:hypothetical protein D777_03501 [Marinobacter nitratireducens]|uniref:Uncharacterized protein n=1 Tax=Marinobacter nitratireducens TaxID=1137280 RepID=A0A072NB83_9GAMM|nr:hypothetical protein D777_03501 [Marinobacter nitratireducens]
MSPLRSFWRPDQNHAIGYPNLQCGQCIALAGASDAFAGAGFEQGAMGGTLDEQVICIQKAAGHPVQFNAQVRALIEVGSGLAIIEEDKAGLWEGVRLLRFPRQTKLGELSLLKVSDGTRGLPASVILTHFGRMA